MFSLCLFEKAIAEETVIMTQFKFFKDKRKILPLHAMEMYGEVDV
jgi:hypothetical protein